jgi:hypothetical protein
MNAVCPSFCAAVGVGVGGGVGAAVLHPNKSRARVRRNSVGRCLVGNIGKRKGERE